MGDVNGTSTQVGEAYFSNNGQNMKITIGTNDNDSKGWNFAASSQPKMYHNSTFGERWYSIWGKSITDEEDWTYDGISKYTLISSDPSIYSPFAFKFTETNGVVNLFQEYKSSSANHPQHIPVTLSPNPGSGTQSTVTGTQSAVTGTQSAFTGTQSTVSGTQSAVTGTQSTVSGTQSAAQQIPSVSISGDTNILIPIGSTGISKNYVITFNQPRDLQLNKINKSIANISIDQFSKDSTVNDGTIFRLTLYFRPNSDNSVTTENFTVSYPNDLFNISGTISYERTKIDIKEAYKILVGFYSNSDDTIFDSDIFIGKGTYDRDNIETYAKKLRRDIFNAFAKQYTTSKGVKMRDPLDEDDLDGKLMRSLVYGDYSFSWLDNSLDNSNPNSFNTWFFNRNVASSVDSATSFGSTTSAQKKEAISFGRDPQNTNYDQNVINKNFAAIDSPRHFYTLESNLPHPAYTCREFK